MLAPMLMKISAQANVIAQESASIRLGNINAPTIRGHPGSCMQTQRNAISDSKHALDRIGARWLLSLLKLSLYRLISSRNANSFSGIFLEVPRVWFVGITIPQLSRRNRYFLDVSCVLRSYTSAQQKLLLESSSGSSVSMLNRPRHNLLNQLRPRLASEVWIHRSPFPINNIPPKLHIMPAPVSECPSFSLTASTSPPLTNA